MQHLLRNKITYNTIAFISSYKLGFVASVKNANRKHFYIPTFIFMIFGFAPACGFAQFGYQINLQEHDDKFIRFGINAGVNRSHYSITHHPQFLSFDSVSVIESVNSTGLNLAWLVNVRLGGHLDLRLYPANLVFTEKAFQYTLLKPDIVYKEDSLTEKKIQGITLAFPLQLKFTSDRIENFKVYMMAGAKIEYDLAANSGKKINDDIISLKKLDYGLEAGIGFHFYFPVFVLSPEIKIGYGLRNVHDRKANIKYSNTIDEINSRTISFSLTVE